jgi:flagellin-like protein
MTRIIDRIEQPDRAVSPVIGVILMVAITVILAAVIGAFVLEIGDQQETAPSTSFDSDQYLEYHLSSPNPQHGANITVVEISHAGGNNIDISQLDAKYRGNNSLWAIETVTDQSPADIDPTPDFQDSLGTNEKSELTSGETMRFTHFNGPPEDKVGACQYKARIFMGNSEPGARFTNTCTNDGLNKPNGNAGIPSIGYPGAPGTGKKINVVWEASSGGKSQNLFSYTIQ